MRRTKESSVNQMRAAEREEIACNAGRIVWNNHFSEFCKRISGQRPAPGSPPHASTVSILHAAHRSTVTRISVPKMLTNGRKNNEKQEKKLRFGANNYEQKTRGKQRFGSGNHDEQEENQASGLKIMKNGGVSG